MTVSGSPRTRLVLAAVAILGVGVGATALSMHHVLALEIVLLGITSAVIGACLVQLPLRRRLRRLAEIVSAAPAAGDRSSLEAEIGTDEVGRLARSLDEMIVRVRAEQDVLSDVIAQLTLAEKRLEQRFERRSESLKTINLQLRNEMERRARAEIELRQAQKLESVGRLAAGIAHEINTPVQFVSDSCSFLQTATGDLVLAVERFRDGMREVADGELAPEHARARIAEIEQELDLGYLAEQVPLAIDRSLQGLERVSTIVRSMKEFAHPDQPKLASADLNRALMTTLTVARNEYKYVADLVTQFGDLPLIQCHLGELNQVFLNIVVNAAHAIEAATASSDRRGTIAVKTSCIEGYAVIEISDDGCGIAPANLDKIFDPFFTTKQIGKGTGQGLAIARSVVVDKHGGRLTVDSELGRGTTFRIELPRGADLISRGEVYLAS